MKLIPYICGCCQRKISDRSGSEHGSRKKKSAFYRKNLFTDIRFIAKLKHEFITQEIDKKLQEELNEIDDMYNMMQA